jgi:hypothetical protein
MGLVGFALLGALFTMTAVSLVKTWTTASPIALGSLCLVEFSMFPGGISGVVLFYLAHMPGGLLVSIISDPTRQG